MDPPLDQNAFDKVLLEKADPDFLLGEEAPLTKFFKPNLVSACKQSHHQCNREALRSGTSDTFSRKSPKMQNSMDRDRALPLRYR